MRNIIACVLIIASVVRAEIPVSLPKCKNDDPACFVKASNDVIAKFSSGIREVNLLPFDPLRLKSLVLDRNPSSPVNVDLQFTDLDLVGLKNMKVNTFTGLKADLSGRTVFEAVVPEVKMRGSYKMDGRVLLLPVVGEGTCDITLKNVNIKFSTDLKAVDKGGKVFATLEHVKMELDADTVTFKLDNLFNGDKALGDNVNKILNESSKEVFNELRPSMGKALGLVGKQLVNGIFESNPYADYFE